MQIREVKAWRKLKETDPGAADDLLFRLLLLVNALSGGLKGTG
jgi:phosphoenolpyruvate carboxylase